MVLGAGHRREARVREQFFRPATLMLAPVSHGFLLSVQEFGAFVEQMLAFCHSAHLFPFVLLGCLTSVSVQTQVALVIRALDCDHAQPRTGHQIWSQASQVKRESALPAGCEEDASEPSQDGLLDGNGWPDTSVRSGKKEFAWNHVRLCCEGRPATCGQISTAM